MGPTMEATFKLLDKVTQPLRSITKTSGGTTEALNRVGGAVDNINNHVGSVKETEKAVKGLGTTSVETATKVSESTKKVSRSFEVASLKTQASIDKIRIELKKLDEQKTNPKIKIDTGKAEAKIRVLKHELRSLETTQARRELEALGITFQSLERKLGGGGRGSGGGGPPSAGGFLGGLAKAAKGIPLMAFAAVAALPAIVALGGALTALAGSLGAAVGGAGVLGVAGMGALVTGIGSIVAVAKPAISAIKETKKAQDAYNKSVQQYGRDSAQAAKAHKAYEQQLRKSPRGTAALLQNSKQFGADWRKATRPAQSNLVGIANDSIQSASSAIPTFAAISTETTGALRTAIHGLTAELTSPEFLHIWTVLGHTFSQSIGPLVAGIGNVALAVGRISQDASPNVISFFQHFERSSQMWAGHTRDATKTQTTIKKLTDQTHAWWMLLKSVTHLFFVLGSSGAQQGMGLVDRMTAQLDKWSQWISDNPTKMHEFFDRSIHAASELAKGIGKIVREVARLGDSLMPVLTALSSISGFGADSGALGPIGALLLMRRLRNGFGGAGAGAAGAAGAAGMGGAGAAAAGFGARGILGGRAAALGPRALPALYGASRAAGAGRVASGLASAGALGRAGLGVAGKAALPIAAVMGAYDFLSTPGTFGERAQSVAHGLSFGIIPKAELGAESRQVGIERAQKYLTDHPQGRTAQQHLSMLEKQAAATTGVYETQGSGGRAGNLRAKNVQVGVRPVIEGSGRKRLLAEIAALKPQVALRLKLEDRVKGSKVADDIMGAFQIRLKKGTDYAMKGFAKDLHHGFSITGLEGKHQIAQNTVDWANTLAQGNKKQKAQAAQLRQDIVNEYRKMGVHIRIVGDNIVTGTGKDWSRIQGLMSSATEKALEDVTKGFTQIQQQAVSALELMGYSHSEAHSVVSSAEKKGPAGVPGRNALKDPTGTLNSQTNNAARQSHARRAIGGRVGGHGYIDNQTFGSARLAPDELVINASQERAADMKLGSFGALERITKSNRTMHGVTKQQNQIARMAHHAKGLSGVARGVGSAVSGATSSYGGVTSGIASLIAQLDSKGFHHGSTTGGTHASGSYHYKGEAVDYGDASNDMQRLWSVVFPQRRKFAELFGPSRTHPGPHLMHYGQGFSDAGLQAQHENHIHMALAGGAAGKLGLGMAGGGMGLAAQKIHLKGLRARGAGVPGALAQSGLDSLKRGMERKVNKKLLAAAGGGGDLSGFGGGGTSGANQALGRKMMLAMGWGPNQWGPLKALWTQESGWNQNARNPSSGAYGIPQALGHGHVFGANPADQIRWGLNYIKQRYGSPAGAWAHEKSHNWYATGGRVGYVGDSLGVGTSPFLKHMEKGLSANAVVGRSSASGLSALKGMMAKGSGLDKLIFDLGTNDGSAKLLQNSLSAADRLTGGAQIYVPTVRGPGAREKNAVLRRMAGGDIHLVDWAGQSKGLVGGDGIHATGKGYQRRANMLERAMSTSKAGGVWDWGGTYGEGGDFTAHKPTLIGVGDSHRGPERVRVTQANDGGGDRDIKVEVHIGKIENHREGDISKEVDRELRKVVKRLRSGTLDDEL